MPPNGTSMCGVINTQRDSLVPGRSIVATMSHCVDEFTSRDRGVSHRTVISDVAAPGFVGFLYIGFGCNKMGNAFLAAYKTYLENQPQ